MCSQHAINNTNGQAIAVYSILYQSFHVYSMSHVQIYSAANMIHYNPYLNYYYRIICTNSKPDNSETIVACNSLLNSWKAHTSMYIIYLNIQYSAVNGIE